VAPPVEERMRAVFAPAYLLDRELGRGGMATVYLARDVKHGRLVALKVLHGHLAATLGPERFRREIGFAATLQHAHILTVLESGTTPDGQMWFTMPYVVGETLRTRLEREQQLPLDDALRIAREVAGAIDYAHRQGVVHRDIKPENILLSAEGQALVADFGIARALAGETPDGASPPPLTETGLAVGTPMYMSPEQAAGERAVTPRSDIYSLGAVLYESLAGEPPFTGPSPQAVIAQKVSGAAPSVRRMRPSVPVWVDGVLARALATVPADRYATAAEMGRALDPQASGATAGSTSDGPGAGPTGTRGRMTVLGATVVIACVLVVAGVFAWRRMRGADDAAATGPTRIAVLPFENIGDSSRGYFADGLADALRGKLAIIPNLEVIAGRSSDQYRHSVKPEDQIGRELGVQYLLTGRVRWANGRVEVSPELVQVVDGRRATTRWEEQYDTTLNDVFGVQASIATRVAHSLGTTLGAGERSALAERATTNTAAYDAYLRGLAVLPHPWAPAPSGPEAPLSAIPHFEEAVRLDTTFALAWAHLGWAEVIVARTVDQRAKARADIDRALALRPNLAIGHLALAAYHALVDNDIPGAQEELAAARTIAPNDPDVLVVASYGALVSGAADSAIRLLRRTLSLDPRSVATIEQLAGELAVLGRWTDAETAVARGLAIDSTYAPLYHDLWMARMGQQQYAAARDALDAELRLDPTPALVVERVMTSAAMGDLDDIHRVLHHPPAGLDPVAVEASVALISDLYWVLEAGQLDSVLALPPERMITLVAGAERRDWSLLHAHVAALRQDSVGQRAWGDTARRDGESAVERSPMDGQSHYLLGVAYAYLGRSDDALRETRRGVAVDSAMNVARPSARIYEQLQRARAFMLLGQTDSAVVAMDRAVHTPGSPITPAWLRIDPTWTPLHANPAFQRLAHLDKPIA
jgi:eukaryotic-like serine/threonine-protein kinase